MTADRDVMPIVEAVRVRARAEFGGEDATIDGGAIKQWVEAELRAEGVGGTVTVGIASIGDDGPQLVIQVNDPHPLR